MLISGEECRARNGEKCRRKAAAAKRAWTRRSKENKKKHEKNKSKYRGLERWAKTENTQIKAREIPEREKKTEK